MSSMRVGQRAPYRERAQPKERAKWGILEKHKDYSLRAKDYNEKKKRLKVLREKALERNPDEFHFAMMNSKTDSTGLKSGDRGNRSLSHDVVKLLKTQDAGYLRNALQRTSKLKKKQEQQFVLKRHTGTVSDASIRESGDARGRHIAFVEPKSSQQYQDESELHATLNVKLAASMDEGQLDVQNDQDMSCLPTMENLSKADKESRAARKRHKRELAAQKNRLDALRTREQDLLLAERELELQRAKIAVTDGGINGAGVRWKNRERRR